MSDKLVDGAPVSLLICRIACSFIAVLAVVSAGSSLAHSARKAEIIYQFTGGTDGRKPAGPLISDSAGNIYGVTLDGGANDAGVVFKLSRGADNSWTEAVLHTFGPRSGGEYPLGGLILDRKGDLYGTTLWTDNHCQ